MVRSRLNLLYDLVNRYGPQCSCRYLLPSAVLSHDLIHLACYCSILFGVALLVLCWFISSRRQGLTETTESLHARYATAISFGSAIQSPPSTLSWLVLRGIYLRYGRQNATLSLVRSISIRNSNERSNLARRSRGTVISLRLWRSLGLRCDHLG